MGQGAWLVVAAGAAFLTDFGAAQVKISRESAIQLSSVMSAHDIASMPHTQPCNCTVRVPYGSDTLIRAHLFVVACRFHCKVESL